MELPDQRSKINWTTERIIACVYRVSNTLGAGFLEKVYENALAIELRRNGLKAEQLHAMKSVRKLDEIHVARCVNYLNATGLKVCLLVNFGKAPADVKRIVLDY